jgi:diguanylate cyclase (GGDEF)-like protein
MAKKMPASNLGKQGFQLALIEAIMESFPDGVLVVNEQGLIQFYNHRFLEIWGLPTYPHIGADDNLLLSMVIKKVTDPETFLARVQELYEHPELQDLCELKLQDGRTLERHSTLLVGDNSKCFGRVWFFRDITSYKKIEMGLGELTRTDPLTNIANRRYFFERGTQEFERARRYLTPLCIASIDIDHFKIVNDTYGHAAGDEVLISLCLVCQKILRKTELMARIGGEEFALLIPDTDIDGALQLAERIRLIVAENHIVYQGCQIRCTISIGVATLQPTDAKIDDCLKRADIAMYHAKKKGRNRLEKY